MTKNQITLYWDVNIDYGSEVLDLEDIGFKSIEDFNSLSESERESILQNYLDFLPQRVYLIFNSYSVD